MRLEPQAVVGLLALLCAACASTGNATPYFPALTAEVRAAQGEWPEGERRAGLSAGALDLSGWVGGELRLVGDRLLRSFAAPGADPSVVSVVVEVEVAETARGAHTVLAEWLAGRQAPEPAQRAQALGVDVGDVAYADAPDGRDLRWVAFVRGNIAVRVAAVPRQGVRPDVATIARALDAEAQRAATLPAGAPIPRPALSSLGPAKSAVAAGDVVPVAVELREELAAPLTWTVGGSAQGYVERDADGRWLLHTTRAGTLQLTVTAIGSNLTIARETTSLRVTGD